MAVGDQGGECGRGGGIELELAVVPSNECDIFASVVGNCVDVWTISSLPNGGATRNCWDRKAAEKSSKSNITRVKSRTIVIVSRGRSYSSYSELNIRSGSTLALVVEKLVPVGRWGSQDSSGG